MGRLLSKKDVLLNESSHRSKQAAIDLMVTRMIVPVCAFGLLISIAQQSTVLLGEYALGTTFYFILQTLPLMGLTPYLMKEVARKPEGAGANLGNTILICLVNSSILLLLLFILLPYLPYSNSVSRIITIVGLCIIPGILSFVSETILIALHATRSVAWIAVVENISRLIVSLIFLFLGFGLESLFWVLFATKILAFVANLSVLIIRYKVKPILSKKEFNLVRPLLLVYGTQSFLYMLYSRMDYLILSLYLGEKAMGHYAIAYRLFEIPMIAVQAVITSRFAHMASKAKTEPLQFKSDFNSIIRKLLLALFGLSSLLSLTAGVYVALLFSKQYPEPVGLSRLFAGLLFLGGLDYFLQAILHATDRPQIDLKAMILSACTYGVSLFYLIPLYGTYGAGWALLITLLFQISFRFYHARPKKTVPFLIKNFSD